MMGPAATRFRRGGPAALVLPLLALGELIGDKLPAAPPRTAPPALIARAVAGGFAGSAFAQDERERIATIALGALGAVAAAFLALRLRTEAVRRTGLPDPVVAVGEDIAALALGLALTA